MRRAFTLIELLAVLVILALLSASAALMVRMPLANARRHHALAQIQVLDSIARDRAQQGVVVRMELDLQENLIRILDQRGQLMAPAASLGEAFTSVNVIGAGKPRGERWSISYDRLGMSPTFAVQIGDSKAETAKTDWLLVLGMTGQSYHVENRSDVHAIINIERNHTY